MSFEPCFVNLLTRFAMRSRHFMAAYYNGLNGKQATWAAKKYKGHRVLPPDIMEALDKAGI
jgi:hypothetical protein